MLRHTLYSLTATRKKWILAIPLLAFCLMCGCAEREPAPKLQYSPEEVKQLNEQIEKIEW